MNVPINVSYVPQLAYIFVRTVDSTPHWACGKVDCDCDLLTDEARDEEQRDEDR